MASARALSAVFALALATSPVLGAAEQTLLTVPDFVHKAQDLEHQYAFDLLLGQNTLNHLRVDMAQAHFALLRAHGSWDPGLDADERNAEQRRKATIRRTLFLHIDEDTKQIEAAVKVQRFKQWLMVRIRSALARVQLNQPLASRLQEVPTGAGDSGFARTYIFRPTVQEKDENRSKLHTTTGTVTH